MKRKRKSKDCKVEKQQHIGKPTRKINKGVEEQRRKKRSKT